MIDEVAAPIVRRIFRMTLEDYGPYQIATQFTTEHIPTPAYHQAQLGVGLWQNREIKYPFKWTSSTIAHILQKHEYLGHTVNFKTRKHFKNKKSHYVDKDQWLIFEDTHAPIIDQETFDNVQQTKTATELAYAEVISYNRRDLERELQNESRQRNRQQSRPKRREEET